MDSDDPLWGITAVLLLILIMAIISVIKTALEHVSESSIRKKADKGDNKAADLINIIGSDSKYQNILTLLLCVVSAITVVYSVNTILPAIKYHIPCVLFMVFLIFLMTLFGYLLPEKISMKYSEKICFRFYGFVKFIYLILRPVGWLLDIIVNFILRIFGINPYGINEDEIEEEIISIVNEGHEHGVIDAGKAEMISNIIELDDKEVQDIMTHKKRIVAIDAEMSLEEALKIMLEENYSRYPLYIDNMDNIIGILHLKDVINAYISEDGKTKTLQEIAREPFFVPETQSVNLLFREMQAKKIHMAIVVDEYGQTAGLVAMEDFLEEIVGNIQDEYDMEEKMILSVDNNSCVVKGSISLEDLEEKLNIVIEHEDFDTLNGLLISILDRIPADGEKATLRYGGYQFDILETMNKMIGQVRITKLPVNSSDIDDDTLNKTVLE